MLNSSWSPLVKAKGRVQTWVISQWKLPATPGHFSAAINREGDEWPLRKAGRRGLISGETEDPGTKIERRHLALLTTVRRPAHYQVAALGIDGSAQ